MYDVGDVATMIGVFTSRELTSAEMKTFRKTGKLPVGVGVDPTKVECTVAVGTSVSKPSVTRVDAGIYTALWPIASEVNPGYAFDAFDSSNDPQASSEGILQVRPRAVPRS